jgi:hypothetical protein
MSINAFPSENRTITLPDATGSAITIAAPPVTDTGGTESISPYYGGDVPGSRGVNPYDIP